MSHNADAPYSVASQRVSANADANPQGSLHDQLQRLGLRFLIAWDLYWAWILETAWRSGGLLPSV